MDVAPVRGRIWVLKPRSNRGLATVLSTGRPVAWRNRYNSGLFKVMDDRTEAVAYK